MLLRSIICLAGLATAHPHHGYSSRRAGRTVDLNSHRFTIRSNYTTLKELPSAKRVRSESIDFVQVASSKIQETVPGATFHLQDDVYVGDNGVAHAHFLQTIDGVDVDDATFNVNVRISLISFHFIQCANPI